MRLTIHPARRDPAWTFLLILCAAVVVASLVGCGGKGINPLSWFDAPPKPDTTVPSDPFWWLTWLAGLCGMIAVAALIASAFIPLIPRRAAWTALGCAIGCGILKAFLAKFLGVLIWAALVLGVGAGVLAAWPYLRALIGWSQYRLGQRLAKDDPRAGVALMAAATGRTRPNGKHQAWRKAALAELLAPPPDPTPNP